MLSSNSTWDRGAAKKTLSPAFVKGPARVVYEFENRRSTKIFSHTLGRIDFRPGLGDALSSGRNEQIETLYDDTAYKSVAHVHIQPVLLGSDLTVLGHGVPTSSGLENCAMLGADCEGTGTDTACERGKCGVGQLTRVSGDRWRYDSLTVPGLYYFVFGTGSVTLRGISRGRFSLPAGTGAVDVNRVASVPATVYLPPNTYSAETFTRRVITTRYAGTDSILSLTDSVDTFIRALLGLNQATVDAEEEVRNRLLDTLRSVLDPAWYGFVADAVNGVWDPDISNRDFLIAAYETLTELYGSGVQVMMSGIKPSMVRIDYRIGRPVYGRLPGVEGAYNNPDSTVRSLTDSVDTFIRSLLELNQATVRVEIEVRDRLLDALRSVLDPVWYGFVGEIVDEIWRSRFTGTNMTNREFLVATYEALTGLYGSGVEVIMSGIRPSTVRIDDRIGRPVYGRLPGVEGAYNNPDSVDTPAKWLTAGADDLLSGTKHLLDNFYRTYLDPETCYPLNLDWLAQHLGFVGGLWNLEWPNATKRLLLRNAHVNAVSGSMWTNNPELDTLRRIDTGRIERVEVDPGTGTVSTAYRYSGRTHDPDTELTTIETFNGLVADVTRWQGILPSRGSLLTLLFMFWALGIKAHSPEELRYDPVTGTFVVRSGLRDRELNAPVNVPYMVDVLRVGSDTDAEVGNYPNQLIADVGTCQDELSANTTVVRMPFYYNRNGRTWDAALSVMSNYAPSTSINRVQYAYAAADLLVADDIFFEPEVVAS